MSEAAVAAPELVTMSESLVVQAQRIESITTALHYSDAVVVAKSLRSMEKGIEEFWRPLKVAAKRAHQNLCDEERRMLSPVVAAIEFLDSKLQIYLQAEETQRREQERQAQEAAKKAEEERLLAEAVHLSELGLHTESEQVLTEAESVPTPAVIVVSSVPKIAGTSLRKVWKWRLKDASKLRPEFLVPDEMRISQVVRAMKLQAGKTVGEGAIEVYEDNLIAMRS